MTITGEEGGCPSASLGPEQDTEGETPAARFRVLHSQAQFQGSSRPLANSTLPHMDLLVSSWASLSRHQCPAKGPSVRGGEEAHWCSPSEPEP